MGADDRDEGGTGCLEHDFEPVGLTLARDGAYIETRCTRCGAVSMTTPDQVTGRAG